MNCTAAEQADANGTLPLGREAPKGSSAADDLIRDTVERAGSVPLRGEETPAPAPNWGGPKAAPAAKPAQEPAQSAPKGETPKGEAPTVMVSRGRQEAPMRIVIYGPHGVGKTQFMVDAPRPVLLPVEVGSETFEVDRLDREPGHDEPRPPRTFNDILARIKWLQTADHDYKTLGIDTADMVEQILFQEAVREHNRDPEKRKEATNVEHVGGGYKKGYAAAKASWFRLFGELERLRNTRKMHVVIAAHAQIVRFNNPRGEDYDRYSLKLHHEAGLGVVQELTDAVLFATFNTGTQKTHKKAKAKGVGGQERVLYTMNDAAFDAKNRYDLPRVLPLEWAAFHDAVEASKSPERLRKAIEDALAVIGNLSTGARGGGTIGEWVTREMAAKPNTRRLAQIKNKLEARVEQFEDEEAEREEQRRAAGDGE